MAHQYSPEEIQRRKDLAKKLVAEGRIGGPRPGSGRPPTKRRAAQAIAEAANNHTKEIIDAFKSGVDPSQPASVRVTTAEKWLGVERQESELRLKEDRQLEDMSADDLINLIASKFARVKAGGQNFVIDIDADEEILELEEGEDDVHD